MKHKRRYSWRFFQQINLKKNKKMFFAIGKRKKVPYTRVNLWFYAKG